MTLSLSLFVMVYAVFVLITLSFALINIYHIVVSGTLTLLSFSVSTLVVLIMLTIVITTGMFLSATDLSQRIILFQTVVTTGF